MRLLKLQWIVLYLLIAVPRCTQAQYVYLDSNGNGIHDTGDQVAASGTTSFDIWLDTNSNRDGSSATCGQGAFPLDINSYSIVLKAVGGTVAWGSFTNNMTGFGTAFGEYADGTIYSNGFGGSTYNAAGTYKLGSLSFTVSSGAPYIAITPAFDTYLSAFGSSCPGADFDGTMKYGADWRDGDGLREYSVWPIGGVTVTAINADRQNYPVAAIDGSGGALICWQQGYTSFENITVQRISSSGARLWGIGGANLCSASGSQTSPRIVTDTNGGAIATWEDHRGADYDIYFRTIDFNGTPQGTANGTAICTATGEQTEHFLASDGLGGAIVAWDDSRPPNLNDIYAQRISSTGSVMWTANGAAVCDTIGAQFTPGLVADGSGGAIIAWLDSRRSLGGGYVDLYAQRMNGGGVPQWQSKGVLVASNLYADATWGPALVSDGSGGAIIEYRASLTQVAAQRIGSNGSLQWGSPAVLSNSAGTKILGNPVSDGAGGAYITWVDGTDVYAGRVTSGGATPWGGIGVPVCTAPNGQYWIGCVSDGAGGVEITWEDRRDEPTGANQEFGDVYAQRLSPNGSPLWNPNGAVVVKQSYGQRFPTVVPDGNGGLLAAWQDYRNNVDWWIYASHIGAAGSHVTGISNGEARTVQRAELRQNYPNPFNPSTTIEFTLSSAGPASVYIFSVDGRLVRRVWAGRALAGIHRVAWDGETDDGRQAATGLYVVRLASTAGTNSRKILLLR